MCRSVVAMGTLVQGNKELSSLAADLGVRDTLTQVAAGADVAPRVKEAVAEVLALI